MSYRYAAQTLRLYRGDTQPLSLVQIFNESTGAPIDLTAYEGPTDYPLLTMYAIGAPETAVHTLPLAVADAENGWAVIEWDTDLSEHDSGYYGLQFQLTTTDGTVVIQTVDRHIKLLLLDPVGV